MTREVFLVERYVEMTEKGINQEVASGIARAMADGMHRRLPSRVRAMLNNDLVKAYSLFSEKGEVDQLNLAMEWIASKNISLPLKQHGLYSDDIFSVIIAVCSLYSREESTLAYMTEAKKLLGRMEYDTGKIYSEIDSRQAGALSKVANACTLLNNKTRDVNVVIVQGAENALAVRIPLRQGETIKAQVLERAEVKDYICSYKGWGVKRLKGFKGYEELAIRKEMAVD